MKTRVVLVVVAAVSLSVWLISAVQSAHYVLYPPTLPTNGWPAAIAVFIASTVVLWLSGLGLALAFAWRRWIRDGKGRPTSAHQAILPMLLGGLFLLSACSLPGPEIVPLDEKRLQEAESRWAESGYQDYHLVVRINTTRLEPITYDLLVRGGDVTSVTRNGEAVSVELAHDYTVPGLFQFLHHELQIVAVDEKGFPNARAELFVNFDAQTGMVEKYKRSTTRRATGLTLEVLSFEPGSDAPVHARSSVAP